MAAVETLKAGVRGAQGRLRFGRQDLDMALIVTRREVRDSFRDWRIIIPTVLLTLFFPLLMNLTAERLLDFVNEYGAEIIATRLIPFLLLVVGFFPTSFSLVIALETFVGEKERNSLEPLLATPLTNTQLYVGKVLASVIPPLSASYLGIVVYLVGLAITVDWTPTATLLIQTVLLTTVQALVMVTAAVIISSQTTSVRASNLLASFIIVPMALLLQVEAAAMFYENHAALWWVILGMVVATAVFMRMGIAIFNREELLGRDIDQLRLGWMWLIFWGRFTGRDERQEHSQRVRSWYRQTWALLPQFRQPALLLVIPFFGAILLGYALAVRYPLGGDLQDQLVQQDIGAALAALAPLGGALTVTIFLQNLRVLVLAAILGTISFGILGVLIFMAPWTVLAFLGAQLSIAGADAGTFFLATVLPHALVELPVLLLASAAAWRWHASLIAPRPGRTLSESWLLAAGDYTRIFVGLVLPLLLLAAVVEAYITPRVGVWVLGG